jgi:hypothetical protein
MWNYVIPSSEFRTVGWGVILMAISRHIVFICHTSQILRAGVVSSHQTVGRCRAMFRWKVLAKSYGLCTRIVLSYTESRVFNRHNWQITSDATHITQFSLKRIQLLRHYLCCVRLRKFTELRKSTSNLIPPIISGSKYFVVSVILKARRL